MVDMRYPIGRAELPGKVEMHHIERWIQDLAEAPTLLRQAIADLKDDQLDTPYRPEGWTVRQVVHHLPDSHMNAYISFRLGLTEDNPTIRTSNVDAWANLSDSKEGKIQISLDLFSALQERWVMLLKGIDVIDFERKIQTLSRGEQKERNLSTLLGIYAWHGKHHVAQILALRERMGW